MVNIGKELDRFIRIIYKSIKGESTYSPIHFDLCNILRIRNTIN